MCFILDFLRNFRSVIFLVSFAPDFEPLPCNTYSIPAVESLRQAQNILRNLTLLQFPRRSNIHEKLKADELQNTEK